MKTYTIKSKIWLYSSDKSAWHFITIPKNISEEIKFLNSDFRRGFGSVPVEVTILDTTWNTSIFPHSKTGSYIMPLKSSVRKKEKLSEGEEVEFEIKLAGS
jgi:hypothetical protein